MALAIKKHMHYEAAARPRPHQSFRHRAAAALLELAIKPRSASFVPALRTIGYGETHSVS